jgi:hypothetical protein
LFWRRFWSSTSVDGPSHSICNRGSSSRIVEARIEHWWILPNSKISALPHLEDVPSFFVRALIIFDKYSILTCRLFQFFWLHIFRSNVHLDIVHIGCHDSLTTPSLFIPTDDFYDWFVLREIYYASKKKHYANG